MKMAKNRKFGKIAKPVRPKVKKLIKKRSAKALAKKGVKPPKAKSKRQGVKSSKSPELTLEKVGEVTHYFPQVNAAAVKLLKSGMVVGDEIYIKGHTTDFREKVDSMQLNRVSIDMGKKGQEIGLFVKSRVRTGDKVYKV